MSPVGPYYPEGFNPIKLLADTTNVRAWTGGVGNTKLGGNYAPTIRPQIAANNLGCSQVSLSIWDCICTFDVAILDDDDEWSCLVNCDAGALAR
jgi:branched-subunit amino acid aminotransferase/4-amino-4-deoxychorismate lyase